MSRVLVLDHRCEGAERIVEGIRKVRRRSPEMPIVVVEPLLKSMLAQYDIDAEMDSHLVSETDSIRLFSQADEACQAINAGLARQPWSRYHDLDIMDLNSLDLAYTFRSLYAIEHLARTCYKNRGFIFATTRMRISSASFDIEHVSPPPQPEPSKWHKALARLRSWKARLRGCVVGSPPARAEHPENWSWLGSSDRAILFSLTESSSRIVSTSFCPLLREITRDNDLQTIATVSNRFTADIFAGQGIRALAPSEHLTSEGQELLRALRDNLPEATMAIAVATKGSPAFQNICENYSVYGLRDISDLISGIEFYEHLFTRVRPRVIIASNDRTPFCKTAVLMGKKSGIPSLQFFSCLNRVHSWARECNTDAIGVYGEHGEICARENGLGDKKIYRIGNPKFDALYSRDRGLDKRRIHELLGIPQERKLVVLVGSLVVPGSVSWLEGAAAEFARHRDPRISAWVKPHPGDIPYEYEKILAKARTDDALRLLTMQADTYELISAADAVIADFSTLGAEAMLARTPVIVFNVSGRPYCVRFEETGAALLVTDSAKFWPALLGVLFDEDIRSNLNKAFPAAEKLYGEKIDGRATARFISAIRDLGGL